MSNKVKVQIDDMTFFVVGEEDTQYVKDLAKMLSRKIAETQSSNYRLNQVQSIVLTALNILDENEKLKAEEKIISEVKTDDEAYRKNIRELELLKEEKKKFEIDSSELKNNILSLREKLKSYEDDNNSLRNQNSKKAKEIEELNKEIASLKEEKEVLENQIYDSQKRIIDLNREIESLNEEE